MIINNFGHPPLSEKALRGRPRKTRPTENVGRGPAAVGTLTRLCTQNTARQSLGIVQDSRPDYVIRRFNAPSAGLNLQ